MIDQLYIQALDLLKALISNPSFSKDENLTAEIIAEFLQNKGLKVNMHLNNVWVIHPDYQNGRPTLLLNSHHDTVKPSQAWTFDPFVPTESEGKLIGLGSNDAGAPLVSLMAAFLYFSQLGSLPYNLIYAATAEEENSGINGIESILESIGPVDLAIIGEPTKMELAIAEKGLMVLDCKSIGKPGHAAREEGINAIYKALKDIEWFKNYRFEKDSKVLGPVKMSVTQIKAGYQHNMVPDVCDFVVDVRTNEHYLNQEALEIIKQHVECEVRERSLRLNSSFIPESHPLVKIAREMNIPCYGSPTTSDQAVISCPSVKMGPGDSARSHTANEFIYPEEIRQGIEQYIAILNKLRF
ncbi:MAG: M20 family metallo-hydrolase [Bacteroidota bacterium]|nr:M20 family metallo-hydrolase [Bacteroidota bacterium]